MRQRYSIALVCAFLCITDVASSNQALNSVRPLLLKGMVVEFLTPAQSGERAGLQPGDVLLRWARAGQSGEIESPFDVSYIRFEYGSSGAVQIEGQRGSQIKSWTLPSGSWGIWVRPNFQGELLSAYLQELKLAQAGKLVDAMAQSRKAITLAVNSDVGWLKPWLLSHPAQVAASRQLWDGYDDAYRESVESASEAGPLAKAELYREWAGGFYERGDWVNAEQRYSESLKEWRKLGTRTMVVARVLNDGAVAAIQEGNFGKAQQYLQEALEIDQRLAPFSSFVVWDLSDLGFLSQQFGDLATAEDYYRKALTIEKEISPSSSTISLILLDLGTIADRRGDLPKAEAYFRRALAVAEKLGPGSQYSAELLSSLAECVLDRGKLDEAEDYEQRALALRKQQGSAIEIAYSFRNLGKIALMRNDPAKADEYYHRALELGEKVTPPHPSITRFLIGLGYVSKKRHDDRTAEEYFRRALTIMEALTPGSLDHAETLADLAGSLRDQGKLDPAATLYQEAMAELENENTRLGGVDEDRARYRGKHENYRKEYISVLIAQQQLGTAFEVAEGSRGRTLFETLHRSQANIREGVDPFLLDRERSLQQSLNAKSQYRIRLLTSNHRDAQITTLDNEMTELLDQYQQVEAEIRAKSPKYAALAHPKTLTTLEIQHLLDPETILLEYCLGEERSFVWVVGADSLFTYSLPKRSEIERLARKAYQLLTERNSVGPKVESESQTEARWNKAEIEYSKTASKLSQVLLAPVAGLLKGKRLLIVGDGALQYIPFSALPVPGKEGMPLIVEHEVVNLPSASVVAELRRAAQGRKAPHKAVAVLADPVFDLGDERLRRKTVTESSHTVAPLWAKRNLRKDTLSSENLTRSLDDVGSNRRGRFELNRLLYSRQEAEAIIAVTPPGKGTKILDFGANRAAAINPDLAHYRIVHFATHSLINNKHPELSGLVLSMVDSRGRPQDGFLQLGDIYNLNLPVDLVVLSACDTGLGEEISGEGLIGLTRGFMYAGASRVVASLWSVSDIATSELMARFYKAMEQDKLRPAVALRAAQLQMWKQKRWKSPYYWAAFQLHGEWN